MQLLQLFCALALFGCVVGQSDDLNARQWALYRAQLKNLAGAAQLPAGSMFHVFPGVGVSLVAGSRPDLEAYDNKALFPILDNIPGNSEIYSDSGRHFSENYRGYLDQIQLKRSENRNLQGQLDVAAANLKASRLALKDAQEEANAGYERYLEHAAKVKNNNPITQDKWELQWATEVATARSTQKMYESQVDGLQTQISGPGYRNLQEAQRLVSDNTEVGAFYMGNQNQNNMPIARGNAGDSSNAGLSAAAIAAMPAPTARTLTYKPAYEVSSLLQKIQEWRAAPDNTVSQTMTFSTKDADSSFRDSSSGGGVRLGGFIAFGGGASTHTQTSTAQSIGFKVTITYVGFAVIAVDTPTWLRTDMFNLPTRSDSPKSSWFGPNGMLERRVTQLVVGFMPCIKLVVDQSDRSHFERQYQASAGVSIGPFYFPVARTSGNTNDNSYNAQTGEFNACPKGETNPTIIAVISSPVVQPGSQLGSMVGSKFPSNPTTEGASDFKVDDFVLREGSVTFSIDQHTRLLRLEKSEDADFDAVISTHHRQ